MGEQKEFSLVNLARELAQQQYLKTTTDSKHSLYENEPLTAELLKSRTNQFSTFLKKFEKHSLENNFQSNEILEFNKKNLKTKKNQYTFDTGSKEIVKFLLYFDSEVPKEFSLCYKHFCNFKPLSQDDKINLVYFYNQHLLESISMPEQARYHELSLFSKTFNFNEEYLAFIFDVSRSNDLELFFSTSLEQQKKKLISLVETLPTDRIILAKLLFSLFQEILLETSITVISDMSDDDSIISDVQNNVNKKIQELIDTGLSVEEISNLIAQEDFLSQIDQEHPITLFFESYDQLKKQMTIL